MEGICLANLWRGRLRDANWGESEITRLLLSWAPSTMVTYDTQVKKYISFCVQAGYNPESVPSSVMAQYFAQQAQASQRPKSLLTVCSAALKCYFEAIGEPSPINADVRKMIQGLIKSGTFKPMERSKTMPRQPFVDLFLQWPDNEQLELEKLRLKAITLMALCLMLRPSDIAPRAVKVQGGSVVKYQFTTDMLLFLDNGSVEVYLSGIKNDYHRDGFRVYLRPSSVAKVCPVKALKLYLQRTGGMVVVRPVFTPLRYPFDALSSASIAKILSEAIQLAGLAGHGFTPKSFRPTGATAAIENDVNPSFARFTGRWASQECFEKHYVHAQPPSVMSDAILLS